MPKKVDLEEYQKFVKKIAKRFENRNEEIMTWGLGISGEAGDVASCIKKTFAHKMIKLQESGKISETLFGIWRRSAIFSDGILKK